MSGSGCAIHRRAAENRLGGGVRWQGRGSAVAGQAVGDHLGEFGQCGLWMAGVDRVFARQNGSDRGVITWPGRSNMPCAPDMTIRCARPARYRAAARRARAAVAGSGSPSLVMPPPRATITSALPGDTRSMVLETPHPRNPSNAIELDHDRRQVNRGRVGVAVHGGLGDVQEVTSLAAGDSQAAHRGRLGERSRHSWRECGRPSAGRVGRGCVVWPDCRLDGR
jgi:hypothetical protein